MAHDYKVVDVFTTLPLLGKPVAVVFDAEELSDTEMQTIARWTNLSETTFLLPPTRPGADYRLSIFTPRSELPFAGHPTLGSAHAVLEAAIARAESGHLVQECAAGLIEIDVRNDGSDRRLTLSLPPATVEPLDDADVSELEAFLGVAVPRQPAPAIVDVGAAWITAQLVDAKTESGLRPAFTRSAHFEQRLSATGVTVFGAHKANRTDIEVRSFAPSCGVDEDPVCGSGNSAVAVLRSRAGLLPSEGASYVATQGGCVDRAGQVNIEVDEQGQVKIGGTFVTTIWGQLAL